MPAVKREAVVHLKGAHEMSERRACKVIGCDRMMVRYRSRRPDDLRLRERLVALAKERRRFGYRRLLIFLRREGFIVNHKRLFRIYREERLMVRKRGGRKRALGSRTPMPGAALPNDRWSLDFVSDQFVSGRRFRILGIYDDCTRECLATVADVSLSGRPRTRHSDYCARQAQDDRQRQRHRADQQCDPGLDGRRQSRLALHRSRQAGAERLYRELQWPAADEFLNETLFTSLMQARRALEEWRRDYNTVRPHSRIGWLTPAAYAAKFSSQRACGAPLLNGSAPWPVAPITTDLNRQTLVTPG